MDTENQSLQSAAYAFPYHYIPQVGDRLLLSRHWPFAASYVAALELVADRLRPFSREDDFRHIDVGCGDGALIHYLSRLPGFENAQIAGVDIDERSIKWARMFNPDADLYEGDMAAINGLYSSATLIEVIEHIPPDYLPEFMANAAKLLRPDGLMLITVPSVEKPVTKKHFQHFSMDSLRSFLEPHFVVEEILGFERKDKLTRLIHKMRTNSRFRFNAPRLNRITVDRLGQLHREQQGCGRLYASCRRRTSMAPDTTL